MFTCVHRPQASAGVAYAADGHRQQINPNMPTTFKGVIESPTLTTQTVHLKGRVTNKLALGDTRTKA